MTLKKVIKNIKPKKNILNKENQVRFVAAIVAGVATLTGLLAFDGDVNVSASLISSIPPAEAQVFPVQTKKLQAAITVKSVPARKELPKQAPRYRVISTMVVSATAYNSMVSQCDGNPFITADGTHTAWGVAAGPYSLPFGTKFRIPGIFGGMIFTVHDRSATPSGHVDIWMQNYSDAIAFGRRTVTIEILG